jgi:two-component system response regulator YesN
MKLLIVDDDPYAREGILDSLSLSESNAEEVMQARDGQTALQIARWFRPDLIITDINMPRMSGIEFAKYAARILPDCRLILISAYADMQYYRQAIELSAVAFIEKPLQKEQLREAVDQAASQWKARMQGKTQAENLMALKRQQVAVMLNRNDKDIHEVEALCSQIGFPVKAMYCCLALRIRPEQGDVYNRVNDIERCCEEAGLTGLIEPREESMMIVVLAWKRHSDDSPEPLFKILLNKVPGCVIGVGMEVDTLGKISESRKAAKNSLDGSFYDEHARIFLYQKTGGGRGHLQMDVYAEFSRLLAFEPERLPDWLNGLFHAIARDRTDKVESVRAAALSFTKEIYRHHTDLYGKILGIANENQIETFVYSALYLTQLQEYIHSVLAEMEKKEEASSRFAQILRHTRNYIHDHYGQADLDLPEIAGQVHFSPAYLNAVFKMETGITVKQYLIDTRMSVAKRMLKNPGARITDIAADCGYSNANYFSKAFRENTGLSPGEFKVKNT